MKTKSVRPSTRRLAVLALLANAGLWGAALPITKPALSYISPYEFLFLRFLLASLVAIPALLFFFRNTWPKPKQWLKITALELVGTGVALVFLYGGLSLTNALEASFISNTMPLFIVIGGVVFFKEKEEPHEFWGLMIAMISMSLLVAYPLLLSPTSSSTTSFKGNLFIIVFNLITAGYFLLTKPVYKGVSQIFVGLWSSVVCVIWYGLLLAIFTPASLNPYHLTTLLQIPSVSLAVVYMGIAGTLIALPLLIYGYQQIEASEASLYTYTQPLFYLPLALLWLGEKLTRYDIILLACICLGVWLAERRTRETTH